MRKYYVFILATGADDKLDFGVTSNLDTLPPRRLARLVWCEEHIDLRSTLRRELQIERAAPDWTRRLIDQANPNWVDLRDDIAPARAA
ncbi:MAG: GIY-YIG nuclease family protein [Hyphomonadaceae bacterium]